MSKRIELEIGEIVNNCRFLGEAGILKGKRMGNFLCRCGKEFIAIVHNVTYGSRTSCKCMHNSPGLNRFKTHQMAKSNEYSIWTQMKGRCLNPNNHAYNKYGGAGLTISDSWKESFENFYRDMGARPSKDYSVERIDNLKGYSKENCKWATRIEQNNNQSTNVFITYKGETLTISQWGSKFKIPQMRIRRRIISGWSMDDVFKYPSLKEKKMFESIGIKILPRDKVI